MKRKILGLTLPAGILAALVATLFATPSNAYAGGHHSYRGHGGSGYYYGYNNNCYPRSNFSISFNYGYGYNYGCAPRYYSPCYTSCSPCYTPRPRIGGFYTSSFHGGYGKSCYRSYYSPRYCR